MHNQKLKNNQLSEAFFEERQRKVSASFFCGYEPNDAACFTCPAAESCPKRGRITGGLKEVLRTFIPASRNQPSTCKSKMCSECCAARENENLFLKAVRRGH